MSINIVTAPEHRYFPPKSLKVFLAGGICNCIQWQEMIIKKFLNDGNELDDTCRPKIRLSEDYRDLYILNPRREDWLDKPGEDVKQIEWEYDMIEKCDVFTMYFAGGESDQPICMYELGRNIERMKQKFPKTWHNRIIITCDESYKRLKDVLVQTRLATDGLIEPFVVSSAEESIDVHYHTIQDKLKYIYLEQL